MVVASTSYRDLEWYLLKPDYTPGAGGEADGELDIMLIHRLLPPLNLFGR
jgi:hypothetical protein